PLFRCVRRREGSARALPLILYFGGGGWVCLAKGVASVSEEDTGRRSLLASLASPGLMVAGNGRDNLHEALQSLQQRHSCSIGSSSGHKMAAQQNPNKMTALSKEVEDMRCPLQVPVKIETPCQVNDSAKEREGNGPATIPSATSEDFTRAVSRVKQELAEEPPQSWECQWQRVLEVVPAPFITPVWDSLQLPPLTQGGSTEAYLATFERVADASQWPREEWVTRLVPVLSGQAQQAYFSLDAKDKADYGKVKVAILKLDDYLAIEAHRQRFRHFCYQAADGPRMACQQLQELCHCWLRPEGQSKEQILDLLILEQFLVILPQEMQDWIRERGPETCDRAVALAEEYLQEQQETEKWAQQDRQKSVFCCLGRSRKVRAPLAYLDLVRRSVLETAFASENRARGGCASFCWQSAAEGCPIQKWSLGLLRSNNPDAVLNKIKFDTRGLEKGSGSPLPFSW
ncbi:Zinc finger protein, partial [Ophiophagus hannah]